MSVLVPDDNYKINLSPTILSVYRKSKRASHASKVEPLQSSE